MKTTQPRNRSQRRSKNRKQQVNSDNVVSRHEESGLKKSAPGKNHRHSKRKSRETNEGAGAVRWWQSPFALVTLGGLLVFASMPPLGIWPLALVATIPWLKLISQPKLAGKRPWLQIWLASWAAWALVLYYIRIPHWMLNAGWLAMSAYLCLFLVGFIAITRHAVHRWKVPLLVAAPISFCGLEMLRAYLFGGFALQLLAHSLAKQPILIQGADLFGGYGLSLILVLTAACIYQMGQSWRDQRKNFAIAATCLAISVAGVLGYGTFRLAQPTTDPSRPIQRIALVQGSVDTTFPSTEEELNAVKKSTFFSYQELTVKALQEHDDIDLVVWPEGKFTVGPDYLFSGDPSELSPAQRDNLADQQRDFKWATLQATWPDELPEPGTSQSKIKQRPDFFTSCATVDLEKSRIHNSAFHFDSDANLQARYHKLHLVMFGEYFPLSDWFPFLQTLTPIGQGFRAGESPVSFQVGEYRFAPSICFESTVPHLMNQSVNQLSKEGESVDAIVNLADDGWFYGAAALDHHLASNVFRAVELRVPNLVAANTGFSAEIDSSGRILQRGPRRAEAVLIAELQPLARKSPYRIWGDKPLGVTSLLTLICFGSLLISRRSRRGKDENLAQEPTQKQED